MPPILSTSHYEFYGARSCAHARKPSLFTYLLTQAHEKCAIKMKERKKRRPRKKFFDDRRDFVWLLLKLDITNVDELQDNNSSHTKGTICLPPCDSRNFYLKHSFSTYNCLSNNSLISAWISTKFVSTLLLCMLYQTNNFQHKANTSMYLRGTFTLYVDSFHNSDPSLNHLNEILDTKTILIYESSG